MAIAPEDLILVSVDDHICEPADIFEGRLPKKYQAEAPFVSEDANGRQQWWYQGKPGRNLGLNAAAGKPIFCDVVVPNTSAMEIAKKYGFELQRPFVRMFLGECKYPADTSRMYAISGVEKG